MTTLVVRLSLDPARGADVVRHFENDVVPWAKHQPGFVSGQWLRSVDGSRGMGVVVFESAQTAHAAAAGPRNSRRDDTRAWNIEDVDILDQVTIA